MLIKEINNILSFVRSASLCSSLFSFVSSFLHFVHSLRFLLLVVHSVPSFHLLYDLLYLRYSLTSLLPKSNRLLNFYSYQHYYKVLLTGPLEVANLTLINLSINDPYSIKMKFYYSPGTDCSNPTLLQLLPSMNLF